MPNIQDSDAPLQTRATRRLVLGAGLALAAGWRGRAAEPGAVLRAGDQKGGLMSVMKAAGVLEGLPFRVEWNQFPAAAPVLEALNAGAVDLAYAGDAPATFSLAAGLPGRIVSVVRNTGAGTAVMVKPDSPMQGAADLRGRTVAANRGSIAHHLLLAITERQGWPAGSIKMTNLLPADAKSALAAGAVDAWASWGVYVAQAKLANGVRVVADGSGGVLPNLSYVVAIDTAIASRRPMLAEFCKRLAAARRWALAHPAEFAQVLAADIGVTEAVARLTFDTDATAPVAVDAAVVADEQRVADRYLAAGLVRTKLDAAKLFDASFNAALDA